MSSIVKVFTDAASNTVEKFKGALDGDFSDATSLAFGEIDEIPGAIKDFAEPEMPPVPEFNAPPPAGATPGATPRAAPSVDLAATEGKRRTTGAAKGSRKLRVPLGGLGR